MSDDAYFAAQFTPDGSAAAALAWLSLVLDEEDIVEAWPLTPPNLRLALVQNVIWWNRQSVAGTDLDELAAALAEEYPQHPVWASMQRGLLVTLQRKWEALAPADRLASLRPRPVDPTHELVLFVDGSSGQTEIRPGEAFVGSAMLLSIDDAGRWQVAGFGEEPPEPGWSPVFTEGPIILR